MGTLQTNCFILINEQKEAIVFDPVCNAEGNVEAIVRKCEGLNVQGIVLTHGHYDHISGVEALRLHYPVDVYISALDEPFLYDNRLNLAKMLDPHFTFDTSVKLITEDVLQIGSFEFKVISTPGHTPGSITLQYKDALFVGDALFKGSVGRTDLAGGSQKDMLKTCDYFKSLTEDFWVYCGHGPTTTISLEQQLNPYLQ